VAFHFDVELNVHNQLVVAIEIATYTDPLVRLSVNSLGGKRWSRMKRYKRQLSSLSLRD
jgi:hypothetical protein